jgi:hypothetical protein
MAKKEYTFKYEDFNEKVNEGINPGFRFSEIEKIIEDEESIDDLDAPEDTDIDAQEQEEFNAEMDEIEQEVGEEDENESAPEALDMGGREDVSIDRLNQKMKDINDYMKIINNNLKLEDSSKMSKKMINDIEAIYKILF